MERLTSEILDKFCYAVVKKLYNDGPEVVALFRYDEDAKAYLKVAKRLDYEECEYTALNFYEEANKPKTAPSGNGEREQWLIEGARLGLGQCRKDGAQWVYTNDDLARQIVRDYLLACPHHCVCGKINARHCPIHGKPAATDEKE
jgi:hypothetical protein